MQLVGQDLSIAAFGKTFRVNLYATTYPDGGRLALVLHSIDADGFEEPFAKLTVNLPDEPLPDGEVFIKNWSENEGFDGWAKGEGIIESEPTYWAASGHVMVPRFRLTQRFMQCLVDVAVKEAQR